MNRVLIHEVGSVLLSDLFTDVDNIAMVDHVPDIAENGAVWSQDGTEDLIVLGGNADSVNVTGTGNCFSIVDVQQQDLKIDVVASNTDIGNLPLDIIVRYIDSKNYIMVRIAALGSIVYGLAIMELIDGVGSQLKLITADTAFIAQSTTLSIISTPRSISVTASVGGTVYSEKLKTTKHNRSTKVGIYAAGSGVTVDSFIVSAA